MTRMTDIPIGRIAPSGYGLTRAAGRIHWYVLYEGDQAAFVDDAGRVICAPVGTIAQRWLADEHADWLVGHYCGGRIRQQHGDITRNDIMADLRARANELYGVAA